MPIRNESYHGPARGYSTLLGRAPADEVVGAGEKNLAVATPELSLRAAQEHPSAVDPMGKQRGVLVFGMPDHAVPFDRAEVLGRREEDGGSRRAVRGAGDHPSVELLDPDNAWTLESPLLACSAVIGSQRTDRATVRCVSSNHRQSVDGVRSYASESWSWVGRETSPESVRARREGGDDCRAHA